MSLIKITQNELECFTIATHPNRSYSSSSLEGSQGSVRVFARQNRIEKDAAISASFIDSTHSDSDLTSALKSLQAAGLTVRNAQSSLSATFPAMVSDYMELVNQASAPARLSKVLEIERVTPSFTLTENTFKKLLIKDVMMPTRRVEMPSAHWAYTNYNCLSFFTASGLPETSALLFPNTTGRTEEHEGYVSGAYSLSGAFSFDFYINPRYKQSQSDTDFKAGTLLHLSSSYAVSLISGSKQDENGKVASFRIQLQLSHSADIKPSLATAGNFPNDLVFLSDEVLLYNNWHHVIVRWGTNNVNDGTGSFIVDGQAAGTFVVPSATITPRLFSNATRNNPDVLCVGNYYEGVNAGTSGQAYFFANDPALRDGLVQLIDDVGGIDEPVSYSFGHPLNADVHDISIKRYYMSDADIFASASRAPNYLDNDIAFYLPPLFVQDSPFRQFVGNHGGILQTPFFEVDGTTDDPFNVAMSFGVAGHYINIENFLRDFANDVFPRLHHLTGTAYAHTSEARSANEFLYDDGFVKKRNLLIMPCDDGMFVPSYELLVSESRSSKFVDDIGSPDYSLINLDNLVSSASLLFQTYEAEGLEARSAQEFINEAIGFTPENPGGSPGSAFATYIRTIDNMVASGTYDPGVQGDTPLTIYQRTRDPSSNQVTMFDISNLYYGSRIHPKSL